MKKCRLWLAFLLLLIVILLVGYSSLSESKKRFIVNMLRQLPYLPARYLV